MRQRVVNPALSRDTRAAGEVETGRRAPVRVELARDALLVALIGWLIVAVLPVLVELAGLPLR
jgi:hypothetical protein